jgi:nucleoside-diphosphate-sugar epimerase
LAASAANKAAMNTLLSIGHGYSAQALARRLLPQGWQIIGTTRTEAGAKALRATGIDALVWPESDLSGALAKATHLLTSVAPGDSDPVLQAIGPQIAGSPLKWVGYLSTTAVYGHHNGDWVDETTPLAPTTARGAARVQAEADWTALGLPLHIFRLAGIYGPGRGPFEKVRDGSARRVHKAGQVFSRIHVDDIARVLHAALLRPHPDVYNVCDDDPASPEDILGLAAEMLGLPPPPIVPYEQAEMTPMARSFYAENKRVRNDRIKTVLGVTLDYPTYREGLAAILAAGG